MARISENVHASGSLRALGSLRSLARSARILCKGWLNKTVNNTTNMLFSIPETEEGDEETYKTRTSMKDMSEH